MNSAPEVHFVSGWRFRALIVSVFIGVLCYFAFSLWGGWEDVLSAIEKVSWKGILICLALSLLSFLVRFMRWKYYIDILGYKVPFLSHLRIYISGFSLSTTPGKTGETIRNLFLHDYGVGYHQSFGAFFAERFSDLLSAVLISLCYLIFNREAYFLIFFVTAGIIVVLVAVQYEEWMRRLELLINKKFPERFAHMLDFGIETILAFRTCFRPAALIYGAGLGIIAFGLQGYAFQYILNILGAELPFLTVQFIYAFSLLVGAIFLLPGGLGGTEVMMLQLLILNGVTAAVAVAATVIIRLATIWFSVALGLVSLPFERLVVKNKG